MSNNDNNAVLDGQDIVHDFRRQARVKITGRLIKNQHIIIHNQETRQINPLLFTIGNFLPLQIQLLAQESLIKMQTLVQESLVRCIYISV